MPEVLLPGFFWIFAICCYIPSGAQSCLVGVFTRVLALRREYTVIPAYNVIRSCQGHACFFFTVFLFSWFISTVYLHVSIIQINKKCALPEIPWKVKLLFPPGTFRAQMKVAPTPNAD